MQESPITSSRTGRLREQRLHERERERGKREKERLCESETSVKWHFSKLIEKVREERVYTRGERVFEGDKREEERGRERARGCSGMLRDAAREEGGGHLR